MARIALLGSLVAVAVASAQNLEFRSSITQETNLAGVTHAAWSPDGNFLYAVANDDNTLIQFIPDLDGSLTFGQVLRDGVGGVDGLDGAIAVAVSPDGDHVYVAGFVDDAVAVFGRDGGSGELTFVETVTNGMNGVDGLDGATSVVVSPDGAHVYVAGDDDNAVVAFSRDGTTGQLTFVQAFRRLSDMTAPRQLAISPDGASVYAVATVTSSVVVLSRDAMTGMLTFIEAFEDLGLFGTPGPNEVQGLGGVNSVAVSPDGAHLYTAARFDDSIVVFDRDGGTGALTFNQLLDDGVDGVQGLNGAVHVAVSPDGANVYAAASVDDAITTFNRNASTGALAFAATQTDGVEGLNFVDSVIVSPDGMLVHGVSGSDRTIVAFTRDSSTGSLALSSTRQEQEGGVVGLSRIRSLAVDPGGTAIYTAGTQDNAIGLFSLDPVNLAVAFVEAQRNGIDGVEGLDSVSDVVLTPDRRFLYAVSPTEDAVAIFNVVGANGELQFNRAIRNGGLISGMDGPRALVVSADNRHLYVAGTNAASIVVFARDPLTGHLIYRQTLTNGEGGISGMGTPELLELSPDGTLLFVVSSFSTTVLTFARDSESGELAFLGDGSTAKGSTVTQQIRSPDGMFVYQLTGSISSETPARRLFVLKIDPQTNEPDPASAVEIDMSRPYSHFEITDDGQSLFATDVLGNVFQFSLNSENGAGTLVDPWEALPIPAQEWRMRIALPNGSHVIVQAGDEGTMRIIEDTGPATLNVAVAKTFLADEVFFPGETDTTFKIVVSNTTPFDAPAVTLRDPLPGAAFAMSWQVDDGVAGFPAQTSGQGPINETFPLPANSSVSLTVKVSSSFTAYYFNEATITGDERPSDNKAGAPNRFMLDLQSRFGFEDEQ